MIKKVLLFCLLFISVFCFSQEIEYKEYSYTEFFQLIENEKDSVFKLKNAIIQYNSNTDQRFRRENNPNEKIDSLFQHKNDIIVDKHLELENVQFITYFDNESKYISGVLFDILFKKSVLIINVTSFVSYYCRFESDFTSITANCSFDDQIASDFNNLYFISFSTFKNFSINKNCQENSKQIINYLAGNTFSSTSAKDRFTIFTNDDKSFIFKDNHVAYKRGIFLSNDGLKGIYQIEGNTFVSDFIYLANRNLGGKLNWKNNSFSSTVFLEMDAFSSDDIIDWTNFNNNSVSYTAFTDYTLKVIDKFPIQLKIDVREKLIKHYNDSVSVYDKSFFEEEISLKGNFYNHYRQKYNIETANEVYVDLKDFETKRLEALYTKNPSFNSFFTVKINQFLKVFSAYGTEPARAVVFSMYVILFFAFIYLLFPNSWDSLGKKRLMHRFEFFQKYLRRNEGIHSIYLEGKEQEISSYNDFKNNLEKAHLELPSFFISWSKPLYNASMLSSKLMTRFLKTTDVLTGKWKDLTPKQKRWKNFQIGLLLTTGLLYDLFIKALNALMLSINTFTTLGFGEIPIKGLPRYLAIIQGFIGWFMLTIFSVSLISQLLN